MEENEGKEKIREMTIRAHAHGSVLYIAVIRLT